MYKKWILHMILWSCFLHPTFASSADQSTPDASSGPVRLAAVVQERVSELCDFENLWKQKRLFEETAPAPARLPFEPRYRPEPWHPRVQISLLHIGLPTGGCLEIREGNTLVSPKGIEYLHTLKHIQPWSYELTGDAENRIIWFHFDPLKTGGEIHFSLDKVGNINVTKFNVQRAIFHTLGTLTLSLPPYAEGMLPDYLEFAAPRVTGAEALRATRGVHVYQQLTPAPADYREEVELSRDARIADIGRIMGLRFRKMLTETELREKGLIP